MVIFIVFEMKMHVGVHDYKFNDSGPWSHLHFKILILDKEVHEFIANN